MRRRHGDTEYYLIEDEEVLVVTSDFRSIHIPLGPDFTKSLLDHGLLVDTIGSRGEKLFRFGYMFRRSRLPKFQPDPNHLIELGLAMVQTAKNDSTSSLPAGYTFLGQFIDHDLTFNASEDYLSFGGGPLQLKSKRSPTLDLDSLYGYEPDKIRESELGEAIYDGAKLKVGHTIPDTEVNDENAERRYDHDLPRLEHSQRAAIVDSRNDENLAIAQTHLAFIKFHNAMADHLSGTVSSDKLFWEARAEVIRHYQRIILDDFLPSLLDNDVITEIQNQGCKFFVLARDEDPFMPVEFAVAAFRMGHSLLTPQYEWNHIFQTDRPRPQPASLADLFVFTENGGLAAQEFLVSSWIIDWTRFFDFRGFQVPISTPSSPAGKIDAVIASRLTELDAIPHHGNYTRSLAVRNLLRGLSVNLPAGQDVAKLLGYTPLEPKDFADLPYYDMLRKFGFDNLTPLWLYILQEAKVRHGGERLGPVGSRIIGETFITLIQASRISILPDGKWQPSKEKFTMAHLLAFVNEASPKKDFLNPLG